MKEKKYGFCVSFFIFWKVEMLLVLYGRDKQAIPKVEYSHKTTTGWNESTRDVSLFDLVF